MLFCLVAIFGLSAVPAGAESAKPKRVEHYVYGKTGSATPGPVSGGLLLMGGGDRNIDAMKWFFGKAGNGHIVVLSASYGKEIGEEFFDDIGGIQSTEIFVMHDRSQSTDKKILEQLRKA
ncbi:MAG: peptidase T, partial [Sphingomonadaceae bacterium]|nr:peptidase T [Sphingomonadaceae bacterium]